MAQAAASLNDGADSIKEGLKLSPTLKSDVTAGGAALEDRERLMDEHGEREVTRLKDEQQFEKAKGDANKMDSQRKSDTGLGGELGERAVGTEKWFQPVKAALLELQDTVGYRAEFDLQYSTDILASLHGTTSCMPQGLTRSMEEEFRENEGGKFFKIFQYVVYEVAEEKEDTVLTQQAQNLSNPSSTTRLSQVRDKGRTGWKLADFANVPSAVKAGLTQAEVAAIRLYTAFDRVSWSLNNALRTRNKDHIQPWATTICILTSAIIKLSQLTLPGTIVHSGMPPCTFKALESFTGDRGTESYVQSGFLPSTLDPKQIARYVGGKFTETVVWTIESTFSSRPADVSSISMYSEERELLFPPCTTLQILAVERIESLNKSLVLVRPHVCAMRLYTDGLLYPWSSPYDPLSIDEYEEVMAAQQGVAEKGEAADGKFASNVQDLLTGEPKAAALGLDDYMSFNLEERLNIFGNDKRGAIEAEFQKKKFDLCQDGNTLWDWFNYVANRKASSGAVRWGDRDAGHEGMRLEDFLAMPQAQKARLKIEHVLALRLYTVTPVSFELNGPLRRFKVDEETGEVIKPISMREAHPFPVTVTVLNEAIKKLRDAEGDAVVILWRGLKNMDLKRDSNFMRAGGVEMSSMSTTYSLKTALFYSHSNQSIIFRIVTRSFMERGADLEWISVFPRERECLFPPCTFLSPTGRTQKIGKFTVVEITPRL
jgi:hypothetical protein